MSEASINEEIQVTANEKPCRKSKQKLKLKVPKINVEYPETAFKQANVVITPISLEDEVLTCGTASVQEKFAEEPEIPCQTSQSYFPFNESTHSFDIKSARERYNFYQWLEEHKKDLNNLAEAIVKTDKALRDNQGETGEIGIETIEDDEDGEAEEGANDVNSTSVSFKKRMNLRHDKMKELYLKLNSKVDGLDLEQACEVIK